MTDIVERLRNPHGHSQIVMRLEAADTIEALTAKLELIACERDVFRSELAEARIEGALAMREASALQIDDEFSAAARWGAERIRNLDPAEVTLNHHTKGE